MNTQLAYDDGNGESQLQLQFHLNRTKLGMSAPIHWDNELQIKFKLSASVANKV